MEGAPSRTGTGGHAMVEHFQEQEKQSEMAALAGRFAGHEGSHSTAIPRLHLRRVSSPSEPIFSVYEPSVCFIAQGRKRVMLAEDVYPYDPAHYLLTTVDLPIVGQVIGATPQEPYLGVRLGIDPMEVNALIAESDLPKIPGLGQPARGLSVACLDPLLLDAVLRLLRLLEMPQHISVLSPMIKREILYLLLVGDQGTKLRRIAQVGDETQAIAGALRWLRRNLAEPLRVEALARQVHMSPSVFHRHFKAVAAMTPLQYQKQMRLQEARRLMLSEAADAATAAYRVGYESPSQFSREYRRLFGDAPQRDIARLRNSPQAE